MKAKVKIKQTRVEDCAEKGYHLGQPVFDFDSIADGYKYRRIKVIRCGHCNKVIERLDNESNTIE